MGNLVEQVRAAEAASRERAAREYREVLGRTDAPKKGDAEALLRCLAALGRSPDDVEADAAVLRRAVALEAEAAQFPEVDAARVAAGERALASATETERIIRERRAADGRLMGESVIATALCRRRRAAVEELARLREQHRLLFGLPDPPAAADAPPVNLVGPGRPVSGSLSSACAAVESEWVSE